MTDHKKLLPAGPFDPRHPLARLLDPAPGHGRHHDQEVGLEEEHEDEGEDDARALPPLVSKLIEAIRGACPTPPPCPHDDDDHDDTTSSLLTLNFLRLGSSACDDSALPLYVVVTVDRRCALSFDAGCSMARACQSVVDSFGLPHQIRCLIFESELQPYGNYASVCRAPPPMSASTSKHRRPLPSLIRQRPNLAPEAAVVQYTQNSKADAEHM